MATEDLGWGRLDGIAEGDRGGDVDGIGESEDVDHDEGVDGYESG